MKMLPPDSLLSLPSTPIPPGCDKPQPCIQKRRRVFSVVRLQAISPETDRHVAVWSCAEMSVLVAKEMQPASLRGGERQSALPAPEMVRIGENKRQKVPPVQAGQRQNYASRERFIRIPPSFTRRELSFGEVAVCSTLLLCIVILLVFLLTFIPM